ncbi:MAG: glutaredoxin domain-containing protein [Boseongicola sp.]
MANEVTGPGEPIVVFALEWCEFCWSVRRLFEALGVSYNSVNLDAASFAGGQEFAGKVRIALHDITEVPTIPQVFIGGEHFGGATETFDAFNNGQLQKMMESFGKEYTQPNIEDAYSLLPAWTQRR